MSKEETWVYARKRVFKYPKSGKMIIVPISQHRGGSFIMDLDNNFQYAGLRTVKRSPYYEGTSYVADILINSSRANDQIRAQFKLLRILNNTEVKLENWHPSKKLENLKILSQEFLTDEEIHWAGKVKGNEVEFFGWWGALVVFVYFILSNGVFNLSFGTSWPVYLILFIWIYLIRDMKFIRSKKPLKTKIENLMTYKRELIKDGKKLIKKQLSELDLALEKYSTWANLSPINFENALKRKLNNFGMTVDTTKTSGDGGIDLEGYDENNKNVLIQAKKYSKPVGVSVVREMIGVRQNHQKKPRTIIYSLEGFTKGAHDLAKDHNIELKSIREDLISK
jgi:HJR/Mrr/RecB family endonuclease